MKCQPLVLSALALTLSLVTGCGQEPQTPSAPQTQTEAQTPITPEVPVVDAPVAAAPEAPQFDDVHDLMEAIADNFKFLRRQTESGQADELLEHSGKIRALVAEAKTMTPEQVEDAQGDEKAALSQAYQEHLDAVGPVLDAYDAAIQADDRAAAAEATKKLIDVIKQGHEALGVKED